MRFAGGIILAVLGFVFFGLSLMLVMNMEKWVNSIGEDWRILIAFVGSPVLIFVGVRAAIIEYRISRFMAKAKT